MSRLSAPLVKGTCGIRVPLRTRLVSGPRRRSVCSSVREGQKGGANANAKEDQTPDSVVEKLGLEAGLFSAWRNRKQGGGADAKALLKRYGGAYLITSISLAIVSFGLCYVAVDAGVDVPGLLAKINIQVAADSASEKAGTLALAYAAHKALSPVRFPPTVALTPLVAKRLGKDVAKDGDGAAEEQS